MILSSPSATLFSRIKSEMVSLGVWYSSAADEAAFRTWFVAAWIDSGCTSDFAVLVQPSSQRSIQFNVRVGVAGHRCNVYWGDGTSTSSAPLTGADTSLEKTYTTGVVRAVVMIGKITRFVSVNADGKTAFGGRVGGLTSLTYLNVSGYNTLSGSVAGLTSLTYLDVSGSNTLSGSVAGLTSLTILSVNGSNTLSGSVAGCTLLTYLSVGGSNGLSGSVAGLTLLTYLRVGGPNTLSGSVAGLTRLTYLGVGGSNTLSGWGAIAASATGLCQMSHGGLTVLDAIEVNAVLAGLWANRDAAKSRTERVIDLGKDTPTPDAAPTGQGLIDKAALQAYRSPNNDPTKALWTVTTN